MVTKSTILLLLTFSSSSLCSGIHKREVSIDNAVDNLADDFNMINEANGMACRHVNDIRQSFEKKVRFVKIKGTFEATHGQFCNLSTFRRTGSATLSSTPTSITINIRLGLGQTYCYFPEYHATFGSIKVSGDVRATAKELSAAGQLTLFLGDDDECIAVLDYIMVETLGDIHVDINGMGPIGWLGSTVVEWIINDFKSELMIKWLETEMRTSLEKVLQNRPFCQYLAYQDVVINKAVDEMLVEYNSDIIYDKLDTLPLNDIKIDAEKTILGLFKAKGYFNATGGHLRSMSTLRRTDDATLSSTPTSITFTLRLGFGHLEEGCVPVLDNTVIERMEGIETKMGGLGYLNFASEKLIVATNNEQRMNKHNVNVLHFMATLTRLVGSGGLLLADLLVHQPVKKNIPNHGFARRLLDYPRMDVKRRKEKEIR